MSDTEGARVCSLCQSAVPASKKMYRLHDGRVGCVKCYERQEESAGLFSGWGILRQVIQMVLVTVGVVCCGGFVAVVRNNEGLALSFALGGLICFALAVIIQLLNRILLALERLAPDGRE